MDITETRVTSSNAPSSNAPYPHTSNLPFPSFHIPINTPHQIQTWISQKQEYKGRTGGYISDSKQKYPRISPTIPPCPPSSGLVLLLYGSYSTWIFNMDLIQYLTPTGENTAGRRGVTASKMLQKASKKSSIFSSRLLSMMNDVIFTVYVCCMLDLTWFMPLCFCTSTT